MNNYIYIYTDGSYLNKLTFASWAIVIVYIEDNILYEKHIRFNTQFGSNNKMEILAVINSLFFFKKNEIEFLCNKSSIDFICLLKYNISKPILLLLQKIKYLKKNINN